MNASELLHNDKCHNKYDIVTASWLHCNVKNENELELFTKRMSKCLKSNGIFTGMDCNTNVLVLNQMNV